MENKLILLEVKNKQYGVILPKGYQNKLQYKTVYLLGDSNLVQLVEDNDFFWEQGYIIVVTVSDRRLHDYTPWRAAALHERFEDFLGQGNEYLEWITKTLKPYIDNTYNTCSAKEGSALMGQSLGGLLTLYALAETESFGYGAAVSPSCWYPDFTRYYEENLTKVSANGVYISSGRTEGKGHKDIKENAVSCTNYILELLTARLGEANVSGYWDDGGHHDNLKERYKAALLWLENKLLQS